MELWVPKLIAGAAGTVKILLNNITQEIYYCKNSYDYGVGNLAALFSTKYSLSGSQYLAALRCTFNQPATCLGGTVQNFTLINDTSPISGRDMMYSWGVHPNFLQPTAISSINLVSTTPMLAGSRAILYGYKL